MYNNTSWHTKHWCNSLTSIWISRNRYSDTTHLLEYICSKVFYMIQKFTSLRWHLQLRYCRSYRTRSKQQMVSINSFNKSRNIVSIDQILDILAQIDNVACLNSRSGLVPCYLSYTEISQISIMFHVIKSQAWLTTQEHIKDEFHT